MQNRAWSTLEIKSVDVAQRIVEGFASTPDVDRGGHSMDPMGAQFTLPMPFLWKHADPIGEVFFAEVRPNGIYIKAKISTIETPGRLKQFVDDAWASVSARPPLVRGLSIGWAPVESKPIAGTKFQRFTKWIWGETSAVVIPMNSATTILAVKSFDTPSSAAFGTRRAVSSTHPGISGSQNQRDAMSMPISEQVTTEQANLQIKSERLAELMRTDEENNGLEEAEQQEKQTLLGEVKSLTGKLEYLQTLEAAQAAQSRSLFSANPVAAQKKTATPFPRVEFVKPDLPKGTLFTRYAMAVAAGKGSYSDTIQYAKQWDSQTPEVSAYVKAMWGQKAVEGTSVVGSSPSWGGQLVNPSTIQTEFVELLRAETIIGRVPGFRMTPFNIPIITQDGGSTFEWVGEGGVKPVGELSFTRTTLPYHKVAGIVVMTEELVRLSTPNAEATARRDLIEQCARFLDQQFIQIAITAGADNPASITNGVSAPNASGTTLAALMADLNTALGTLTAAGLSLDGLVIVTTPEVALRLSLMVTTIGTTPSGFSMTPSGGTLLGYPVIVSNSVDADTLVIFKPSEIFLADDGRVTLDASNQATLSMTGGATATFNLWQRNCVGIRAERWITWQKRRPTVVAIIDTIAYVPGT